jgi:hypothetical protein
VIRAGEIKAYRVWRSRPTIDRDSWILASVSMGTIWRPGVPMDGDVDGYHRAGVFAFKDLKSAQEWALADDFRYPVTVVGEVDMWGLVMEHERGYRAQYARPRAFLEAKGRNSEAALAELRSCFDV